ncbi:Two pore calcium channel protein 1A [Capsicum annuum]|nr:Two pore calcium channel protein 1A [Capsicum annuum]KAF3673313.1 Two pore calcium channel protein 1A [Capsicum annuum]
MEESLLPVSSLECRSDAVIAKGSLYHKAAAFVDLADDGAGIPEEILEGSNFEKAAPLYFMFNYVHLIGKFNSILLVILNFFEVISLLILSADIVVYMLFLSNFSYLPFRIAPYLRVVFLILNNRELREIFLILAGMFGAYLNVVALSALYLLFSSWLGYVFFTDTRLGKTTFTSYGTTLYQMFLLFTASNHPDVWIPAYKDARWYCLFFILYVIVSIYVVVNLILAGIYGSFDKGFFSTDLTAMFPWPVSSRDSFIALGVPVRMLTRTIPEIPRDDFELIFNELDVTHDFKINLDEFDRLCNIIALKFEEEDSLSIFEKCPNFYHSPASEKLRGFIQSTKFENIIVFVLLVNLVAVIIETMLDMQDNSAQTLWQKIEISFGWLYVIEMALKVYTYGFGNYWRDGKNQFDFCITCFIVIEEMTILVDLDALNALSNRNWIRYLLITRMLRFVRLLIHIRRFRAFVATFLRLMYSLLPYWGTIFCIICIYCSLGLQIFGGIVNTGNPNLNQTALASYDYLLFNFNDYPNGMVTLFNLLVMGIWPPVMQSYKELTGTSWTYSYFFSFYLIAALWLLNLIMVFVLEAFRVENEDIELSARRMDDEDKDERSEQRRTVGTKNRRQKLDDLHHRMVRERT